MEQDKKKVVNGLLETLDLSHLYIRQKKWDQLLECLHECGSSHQRSLSKEQSFFPQSKWTRKGHWKDDCIYI